MPFAYSFDSPVHKITVTNSCKIKINYEGTGIYGIQIYDLATLAAYGTTYKLDYIFQSKTPSSVVTLPKPGDYFIRVVQADYPDFPIPYSVSVITTSCDNYCIAPGTT